MTAEEAVKEARKDAAFFARSGGGVTLSGGEPFSQGPFAEAVLRLCRAEGLHTAAETAGLAPWENYERALPFTSLFLYDVKHLDSKVHEDFTGVGNELILSNLRRLAALKAPLIVRTPLIPGFNDDPAFLESLVAFVREIGVSELNLLPYHSYGSAKYRLLRRPYPMGQVKELKRERAEELASPLRGRGVDIRIGG